MLHIFFGGTYIGEFSGHLKAFANSGMLFNGPTTLKRSGEYMLFTFCFNNRAEFSIEQNVCANDIKNI